MSGRTPVRLRLSRGAVIVLLTLVLLALGALAGLLRPAAPDSSAVPAPLVGHTAPDFSLPTLRGTAAGPSVELRRYRGTPLLLQFWAVDCPSCVAERPALLRAGRAFNARGGRVIGVDAYIEPPGLVGPYVRLHPEPYDPILLDPNGDVIYRYRVTYVPSSYFIGADGVIRAVVVGQMSEAAFDREFRRIEAGLGAKGRGT